MTILSFHYPKARKPHKCAVCRCVIPRGTTYHRQSFAYAGTIDDWIAHPDCAEMHWHHNRHREVDDQDDDYLRCGYRGRWPHAINRIELRIELSRIKRGIK